MDFRGEIDRPSASTVSYENRLSTPFVVRFPAAATGAFVTGLTLGLSHGGKTSGLRFRAENSHRFPTTSTGWYLYHKSKNYHMMLGGIKEGLKMGSKVGFWAGGFFLVEEAVDRVRGTKDFLSTVIAGLSISGGFSAWSKELSNMSPRVSTQMADDCSRQIPFSNGRAHCAHRFDHQSRFWTCARCSWLSAWS